MRYRRKTANGRNCTSCGCGLTGRIVRAAALTRRTSALVRTAQLAPGETHSSSDMQRRRKQKAARAFGDLPSQPPYWEKARSPSRTGVLTKFALEDLLSAHSPLSEDGNSAAHMETAYQRSLL